jgi:hypothetical protein
MELLGIIGEYKGPEPRKILLTESEINNIIPKQFNKKTRGLKWWMRWKHKNR